MLAPHLEPRFAPLVAGFLFVAFVAAVRRLLTAGTLLGAGFLFIPILITGTLFFALAFGLLRSVWFERIEDGCVVVSYWHGRSALSIPIGDIHSWFGPVGSNPFLPESLRLLWYWVRVADRSGGRRSYVVNAGTAAVSASLTTAFVRRAARPRSPCSTVHGSRSDRAHERRVPLDNRGADKCWAATLERHTSLLQSLARQRITWSRANVPTRRDVPAVVGASADSVPPASRVQRRPRLLRELEGRTPCEWLPRRSHPTRSQPSPG